MTSPRGIPNTDRVGADAGSIRPAARRDAAAVAEVLLRSRHHAVPEIPPLIHSDDDVRKWVTEVLFEHCEIWVAEQDQEGVVGMMALGPNTIEQLYVTPAATGQGRGAALVSVAKERRPRGLTLWTFESNLSARRFYERNGFTAVEHTDGSGNEERVPDIRYVWHPRLA